MAPVSSRYPSVRPVLLVLSALAFSIFTLAGFDVLTIEHLAGWEGLGFVAFVLSFLI